MKKHFNQDILKPPISWRLFLFIFISIFHLCLLVLIYFKLIYCYLFIVELFFFLFYSRYSIRIFFKSVIIAFIIFIINIFGIEGKIIFEFYFLKISSEGLMNGLQRSLLLLSSIFFTYNILKNNKNIIINYFYNKDNNNLIFLSISFFFIFLELLTQKYTIKKIIIKIIRIYKKKEKLILEKKVNKNINQDLKSNFYLYNMIFFISVLIIFILDKLKVV